jgi:adenylosuccinate lyase
LLIYIKAIDKDLENNWAVVAEAMQTILRREGFANPYEVLKDLTRTNEVINAVSIAKFIDTLDVRDEVKAELKHFTPQNYTGVNL